MLMKDNSRKRGAVSLIIKKMKGGDHYESMKQRNEAAVEGSDDIAHTDDYSQGFNAAAQEMISAFQAGDAQMLKGALISFLDMYENQEEVEEEDY
jgi:hypothetical protein